MTGKQKLLSDIAKAVMRATRCPFCGSAAEAQSWHGGGKRKTLVGCSNDECEAMPSVTGETPLKAVKIWNTRAA